jgi:glycerophosphoryl diester phosphodiesterase
MSRSQTSDRAPLIIGHRGSSRYAPENTIVSFDMAIEEGADGIELDVRLARDLVPVVIHDASLLRTGQVDIPVEEYDSTLLSKCYVGAWYNERHPDCARPIYAIEPIPTLAQVFERYGAHHLYVEMKCEEPSRRADLARAVVRLMREHGLGERVVVKSFEHDALAEVKRVAPEVRTAALFGRSWPRPLIPPEQIIAAAVACGADEISLHRSLLRKVTVRAAHGRGLGVVVWTANGSVMLRRAVSLKLRAVITDCPRYMKAVLTRKLLPQTASRRSTA